MHKAGFDLRMRIVAVSVVLGVALASMAILGWFIAKDTTGPWFSPGLTLRIYSLSLIGAMLLALVLAAIAANRTTMIDLALWGLDTRIDAVRNRLPAFADRPAAAGRRNETTSALWQWLFAGEGAEEPAARQENADREGDLQPGVMTNSTARQALILTADDLLTRRQQLIRERKRMWVAVTGPIAACVVFIVISSTMLPGSEGFAVQNFQLNTTLILFLAYGWGILLAWSALALAVGSMGSIGRR